MYGFPGKSFSRDHTTLALSGALWHCNNSAPSQNRQIQDSSKQAPSASLFAPCLPRLLQIAGHSVRHKHQRISAMSLSTLWEELLSKKPANKDLCYVIEYLEPLRDQAWQQLLAQNPSNDELLDIIEYLEPLRGSCCCSVRSAER